MALCDPVIDAAKESLLASINKEYYIVGVKPVLLLLGWMNGSGSAVPLRVQVNYDCDFCLFI